MMDGFFVLCWLFFHVYGLCCSVGRSRRLEAFLSEFGIIIISDIFCAEEEDLLLKLIPPEEIRGIIETNK